MRRPPLAAALLALAAACAAPRPQQRPIPRPPPGPSRLVGAEISFSAPDLAGREVQVGGAAGRGLVQVVDFWASWCEPCKEQLPHLDRLARDHRGEGLRVTGVAFDEDRAAVEAFLAPAPVAFQILWDPGGTALGERLDVQRLPTTLVIDRRGVVRHVHRGYDRAEGEKLDDEVRQLLAEPAP
ncbi:TlpA disulfide reductase family protein [Anaeromyxobacter sp. PSR-1]|uniref:TlpA disulfide reductase family protein n=1 Tax=Anaeromyxobacter sp. PSR-1 TaxID=1300915 RepID=UPI0005DFD97E|nr:TlpA disulfide reductase family protein [Anaeromyxobacter sp. PSR-1]GAO05034.1 thiol-disulfide oxidoreductase ResA [Anaeromyxobacter sp. PSR-1]